MSRKTGTTTRRAAAWTAALAATAAAVTGCECGDKPAETPEPTAEEAPPAFDRLERAELNRLAVRANLPLYWAEDGDGDGAVDPDEVRSLAFYPTEGNWVTDDGSFTGAFTGAYERLVSLSKASPSGGAEGDAAKRLELVAKELDQGKPTLVESDFREASEAEKKLVGHMLKVASSIDVIYAKQTGMFAMMQDVADADPASQSLFRRNWGPRCRGPETEGEADCSAVAGAPKPKVDVYPASLQDDPAFCETLARRDDAETLLSPFTVVREREAGDEADSAEDEPEAEVPAAGDDDSAEPGQATAAAGGDDDDGGEEAAPGEAGADAPPPLRTVPYSEAYADASKAIASELRAAADSVEPAGEEALATYLRAAAQAFEDNDWAPADEAWAAMNAENSKWYVRVGPDEVYWDPCSRKAGYHLTFARINQDSVEWQEKLSPARNDMEKALAEVSGGTYEAQEAQFDLPDFIDIVLNAGDDRNPFGATIGQSLPNWGAVREEKRGRTVAMTNLYTDQDSLAQRQAQAASLLDQGTLDAYDTDPLPGLLGTIIHEAGHNLGPTSGYTVEGQKPAEAFGGPMASMLEELKAQTQALFFLPMLEEREIIDAELARKATVANLVWALGHVSRGMTDPEGRPKPYSQLAAIQLGYLMDKGAVTWDPLGKAANGEDKGAFHFDVDAVGPAIESLMGEVIRIKATHDKAAAEALVARYVDGDVLPKGQVRERFLRFPKASFVYSIAI